MSVNEMPRRINIAAWATTSQIVPPPIAAITRAWVDRSDRKRQDLLELIKTFADLTSAQREDIYIIKDCEKIR